MAKKFFPEISELIPAGPPHPTNTQYKVSLGLEEQDGKYNPVIKVQMVYDGTVLGRKNPSYPLGTNDYERVFSTIQKLVNLRNAKR